MAFNFYMAFKPRSNAGLSMVFKHQTSMQVFTYINAGLYMAFKHKCRSTSTQVLHVAFHLRQIWLQTLVAINLESCLVSKLLRAYI